MVTKLQQTIEELQASNEGLMAALQNKVNQAFRSSLCFTAYAYMHVYTNSYTLTYMTSQRCLKTQSRMAKQHTTIYIQRNAIWMSVSGQVLIAHIVQ